MRTFRIVPRDAVHLENIIASGQISITVYRFQDKTCYMNIYALEVLVNIVECYMPVFKLISSIKVFPEGYGDYDSTRRHIIDTVEDVVRNSEKISLSDSELDAAFYSIVVMLDEVILCSELPYRKEWRDNLLQIKYFGHSTGGVEFLTCLIKSSNPEVRLDGFSLMSLTWI